MHAVESSSLNRDATDISILQGEPQHFEYIANQSFTHLRFEMAMQRSLTQLNMDRRWMK